ncbi:MAG: hypothetical protein K2H29_00025 [Oscillospiraceae bacterium]|nr:hypothetical protein [Oscillospiraceae bacterium]
MRKIMKTMHITLTVISWEIFMVSLMRIALVWNALSDKIGVHFASNGEFDVMDSKNYIAYPCLISIVALVLCEISILLSKKIKTGMKISEKGDIKIRTALEMFLDIFKLAFSFFFSGIWIDCVIRQHPLNTNIPVAIMLTMFFIFFVFIIAAILIKTNNPPEQE